MPERWNAQQIENHIVECGLNNPRQLELAITNYLLDNPIIQCHLGFINNDENAYNGIAARLSNKLQRYANLPQIIQEIILDIRERFHLASNIVIDDWQDENVRRYLLDLHKYVKNRLREIRT